MKIIVILTIALLLSISVALAQTTKSLQIDIRGRDCLGGSGLCSTAPQGLNKANMKNFTIIKQTTASMLIEIDINALTIEDQRLFFGKEFSKIVPDEEIVFIQDEDFIFDINTLLYLELDPGYRLLKRGSYPIEIRNNIVHVSLSLSMYR